MNRAAFQRFQQSFLGATKGRRRRVYLDGAATSLMPLFVLEGLSAYFDAACANPHTDAHLAGRATTQAIEDARGAVAQLLDAPRSHYSTIFCGSGSTAALNRAAKIVRALPMGARSEVLVSAMEHHSNHLPWTEAGIAVQFIPTRSDGSLDVPRLRSLLEERGSRVRAVAVSAASNVTGAVTPIHEVAALAHRHGALCVVDAAQAAPHMPVSVVGRGGDEAVDMLAISGHKLFAPGSPGVLFGARGLFEGRMFGDVGGGTVDSVSYGSPAVYSSDSESREEAGTPNVPGILSLGMVCLRLLRIGMDAIEEHDRALTRELLAGLRARPWIVVYGSDAPGGIPRVGTVSFNLRDVPHGVVAAALSDQFGIAVRNQCFCAQPYVRGLLRAGPSVAEVCLQGQQSRAGMVRASLGPWSTSSDVEALLSGIDQVQAQRASLCRMYVPTGDGSWRAKNQPAPSSLFSLRALDSDR